MFNVKFHVYKHIWVSYNQRYIWVSVMEFNLVQLVWVTSRLISESVWYIGLRITIAYALTLN